jgi:diguanylate cyclase (GGDEF)-like protein
MKKQHRSFHQYMFYSLIVIETLCILFVLLQKNVRSDIDSEVVYSMNDGWIFHQDNGNLQSLTLPAVTDPGEDNTVIISNTIPNPSESVSIIGIMTEHQSIVAYIEDEVIYSNTVKQGGKGFFDVPTGSVWHLIPVKPYDKGKTLTLVLSSEYADYAGLINEVHIGTKASILLHSIDNFGIGFLSSIIIVIMGSFLVFLYIFIKRLLRADKSLYYLGWFSIVSGTWLLTESNLTQLFVSNAQLVSTVSYFSLMTIPLQILLYVNQITNYHYKKLNTWLILINLVSDIFIVFMQFMNICDFNESMPLMRVILLPVISILMVTLWLELFRYKNREVKVFTLAATALIVFSIIELIKNLSHIGQGSGSYLRNGIYLFLFILTWDGIKKIVDSIKLSERATHYRQLAYRDPLTNCRNRIAYEMDIEKIDTERDVTIFMTDMNNMKELNDNYGHQIGDEGIILCSQCLLKVFGRDVYRIGGDEFLCIGYNLSKEAIYRKLSDFYKECELANADHPYKFDLSIGYATYDPTTDMTIHDTIKRADTNMYETKERMKTERNLTDSV